MTVMTIDVASDVVSRGIELVLLISVVAIAPSLVVGLIISVFQATTQINEQTLSFLPRLVVTLLVLIFAGKWMLIQLTDFSIALFHQAVQLIG